MLENMSVLHLVSAAIFMTIVSVAPVRADNQSVDYVTIECDTARESLRIEKHSSASSSEVPHGRWIRALNDMIGLKQLPRDDASAYPTHDLQRTCKLGNVSYLVRMRAVVFGSHILGRCGAADPSVEVSVWRDRAQILKKFLMVDNCGDTQTSGLNVSDLNISEKSRSLRLTATLDYERLGTPFVLDYNFETMKSLTLEKAWVARPTSAGSDSSTDAR